MTRPCNAPPHAPFPGRYGQRVCTPRRHPYGRGFYECATVGIDEFLQGVGSDPWGSMAATGLRIPGLATPAFGAGGKDLRYIFECCRVDIPGGARKRILYWRQFLKLGGLVAASKRPVEFLVGSTGNSDPSFAFSDGNVSWHVMRVVPSDMFAKGSGPLDTRSFRFRMAPTGPALLYETATFPAAHINPLTGRPDFYTFLTSYTPPKLGRPPGTPLAGSLSGVLSIQAPWDTGQDIDLIVPGPCSVIVYAVVRQTNISARATGVTLGQQNLSSEEEFVDAISQEKIASPYTGANFWKVGAALGVETVDEPDEVDEPHGPFVEAA